MLFQPMVSTCYKLVLVEELGLQSNLGDVNILKVVMPKQKDH